MTVMKAAEVMGGLAQMVKAGKGLGSKEPFFPGMIKSFYNPVAPRLGHRNKHRSNAQSQGKPNNGAKTAWIAVTAPKG